MEPISTSLIVAALVPLVKKGAEKLIDKTIETGFDERRRIWDIVKGVFAEDDLTILNFESTPDDPRIQGKLEAKLEDRLEGQPQLVKELEELMNKLSRISQ